MKTSLWQSTDWETFQQSLGHKTHRLNGILALQYPLPGGFQYLYIPRGPQELKYEFLTEWDQVIQQQKIVFTKLDAENDAAYKGMKNTVPSHSSQPETSLIVDLTKSEEDILKQMKRKGRYNIRLADKKGIIVKKYTAKELTEEILDTFYRLLQQTTSRDAFSGHNKSYYKKMIEHIGGAAIYMAYFNNEALAAAITVIHEEVCIYYYGASGNTHRELMAPYLLQWKMMTHAKTMGCTTYDLLGIAPENAGSDHPWHGITAFKKKFGGEMINYSPAIDVIHRPIMYKIYKALKKIQRMIKS